MFFIQPIFLWFLTLCAIPPIIHLVNRMRYRSVKWAAIQFVIKAHKSSTKMARLRELLILLMRILAIAAFATAISRPLISKALSFGIFSQTDENIVILDRSASMSIQNINGKSRLQHGIETLIASIENKSRSQNITMIENVYNSPKTLKNINELNNTILASPTEATSSITSLLNTAYDYIKNNNIHSPQLWIISDGQAANWNINSHEWEELNAKFADKLFGKKIFLINSYFPENQTDKSLKHISAIRNFNNPDELEITLAIETKNLSDPKVPLNIKNESGSTGKIFTLDGNSTIIKINATLPESKEYSWTALEIPADNSPFDNKLFYAYSKLPEGKAAVICSDPDIKKAISAALSYNSNGSEKIIKAERISDINTENLALFDCIFIEAENLSKEDIKILNAQLENGNDIFIFPPSREYSSPIEIVNNLHFPPPETASEKKAFSADKSIPLSILLPPEFSDIMGFAKFAKRTTLKNLDAIIRFEDGPPLLSAIRKDLGTAYIFLAPLALSNTDFIYHPAFPVIIRQIFIQALEKKSSAHNIYTLLATDQNAGESTRIDEDSFSTHFINSGIYSVGKQIYAVNTPLDEYSDEYLESANFAKLLSQKILVYSSDNANTASVLTEISLELIILAMIFLLSEIILCSSPMQTKKVK